MSLFEEANCIFKEIHREHDYGHDAFVQLVDGEKVLPKELALQIKSGGSYCKPDSCRFPVNSQHLDYWRDHPLHTYGIVFDPNEGIAYWIDLKAEAQDRRDSDARSIQFPKGELNRLDKRGFHDLFLPPLLGRPPILAFEVSQRWALSEDFTLHDWGVHHLLHCHRELPETWDTFFRIFKDRSFDETTPYLIHALAHFPGHYDVANFKGIPKKQLREDGLRAIADFGKPEAIKLLRFVDDDGFERGTIGQGVGAIISAIDNWEALLQDIVSDNTLEYDIWEMAEYLLDGGIGYPMRPRGYDLRQDR